MEDGLFPWADLMVQFPWYDILKNQFTKSLDPSLGVNQMWTKRNDHGPRGMTMHQKVNVLKYMSKRTVLKEEKYHFPQLFCLLLSSSSRSLLPKKNSLKLYYNNISLPWALAFFYQSTSFASPTGKPVTVC